GVHDLQGHDAVETFVVAAMDRRHSAARDQPLDPVAVVEVLADAGGSRRRRTHEANLGRRARRNRLRHTDCGGADRERHRTGRRCGVRAGAATWHSGGVSDLAGIIREWLTLPDVAERLDVAVTRVRGLIEETELLS